MEAKQATRRADDAEAYAVASIDFAMMAIDEAEVAVLEAIDARVYAESLPQKWGRRSDHCACWREVGYWSSALIQKLIHICSKN